MALLICSNSDPDSRAERIAACDWQPCHCWLVFLPPHPDVQRSFLCRCSWCFRQLTTFWTAHRGSPHVHGLAWLPNAPDVEKLLSTSDDTELQAAKEEITRNADSLVSTFNPAVCPDGIRQLGWCYPVEDWSTCLQQVLCKCHWLRPRPDLVAACQRHTRCSHAYCLRTKNGHRQCRFGYRKPLQANTTIVLEDEPTLLIARNDGLINSFNFSSRYNVQHVNVRPAWWASIDMLHIVSSWRRVLEYCTKYVTKSEPRSHVIERLVRQPCAKPEGRKLISSQGSKAAD